MFLFVPISIIQLTDELWTLSCTFKVDFKSTHCSSLRLPHLLAIDGVMPALGFVFTASVSRKMCNTDTPPTLSLPPATAKRVSEASPCASHQEQICPPDSNKSPGQPPLKVKLQADTPYTFPFTGQHQSEICVGSAWSPESLLGERYRKACHVINIIS